MSLILRTAAVSHRGLVRERNEDVVFAGRRLAAVADGMGGMPAGEVASGIVISALAPLEDAADDLNPLPALRAAVAEANRQVRAAAAEDPANDGMGTTLTALLLAGDRLALMHVGDSRGYLLRGEELFQLTKDDTFVQSLVDQGVITAEGARRHPHRALVTLAVQGRELRPGGSLLTPRQRDRYLLCSDGLSDYVADEHISRALVAGPEPRSSAEALVELALEAGAPDNVSVVVADVVPG